MESLSVKKGKLFSVEEFIHWLGQFKSLNTIEIILIIERFRKLDNVAHFFCFFVFYCSFYLVRMKL